MAADLDADAEGRELRAQAFGKRLRLSGRRVGVSRVRADRLRAPPAATPAHGASDRGPYSGPWKADAPLRLAPLRCTECSGLMKPGHNLPRPRRPRRAGAHRESIARESARRVSGLSSGPCAALIIKMIANGGEALHPRSAPWCASTVLAADRDRSQPAPALRRGPSRRRRRSGWPGRRIASLVGAGARDIPAKRVSSSCPAAVFRQTKRPRFPARPRSCRHRGVEPRGGRG